MSKLRYPAIPLITVDPYFSIWSCADELCADSTRQWTGRRHSVVGLLQIDDAYYKFMGKINADGRYHYEPDVISQTNVTVRPMTTIYTFENELVRLTLEFMTPLMMKDLKLMSRPVSYITYKLEAKDDKSHKVKILFGMDTEICVDLPEQEVKAGAYENGVFVTSGEQNMLKLSGDNHNIEWGSLHMFGRSGYTPLAETSESLSRLWGINFRKYYSCEERSKYKEISFDEPFNTLNKLAYICLEKEFELVGEYTDFLCAAYDDIHSINYFGKLIDAYYKKDGETFENACKSAIDGYELIKKEVVAEEEKLLSKATEISPKYADIVSLAYRQAIAGHKLVWDGEELQFLSKENYSNGCIGTLDVTYPSIPMFLMGNPELVEGLLNPIFKYAAMDEWEYDFAPHDVGQYPLATGQSYGGDDGSCKIKDEMQMPVEECGNAIICVYTICHHKKNADYFIKHRAILEQWTKYLIKFGLDPGNQLCTDDFAGHLAHNCNLAVKAIVGIAAYAKLLEMTGDESASKYMEIAKDYARQWEKNAFEVDHYRLAFDKEGSWSLKYNMVWDRIFGWNLFSDVVYKAETDYYLKQIKKYGVPLDSRSDYTKSDWLIWTLRLTDDKEYRERVIESLWNMLNETPDRVPFTDWYFASTSRKRGFQNRTVQGGLFIPLI